MARNRSFVGREAQLDELRDLWRAAVDGRGAVVVVSGEAGIGKTRLVEELAAEVARSGGGVAWGSCAGPDAPPLWPWQAVLRALAPEAPDAPVAPDTTADRPEPGPGPGAAPFDLVDPAGDPARNDARIVGRLRDAAADRPLLLVLDDLHWADPDSLRLLRLAAGEVRRAPLLVVGTLRPDEVATAAPVRTMLSELASSTEVVHLDGLPAGDVARLVGDLIGGVPTDELAAAVAARTGGNPFFVRELLRLLVAEGGLDGALSGARLEVPPVVRDVLLRRVAQLSAPTRRLLDAAAVAGRRSRLPVLAAALGEGGAVVRRGVEEAEAARLVTIEAQDVVFAHDLVREALVAELDAGERRRLHLAVAHALRSSGREAGGSGRGSGDVPVAELAGHLLDALPDGDPADAAAAALAAGREALAQHAPTDAVRHLERGAAALGGGSGATPLLIALGDAHTVAGDRASARRAYGAAAAGARGEGDAEQLAVAALGFAGVMGAPRPDPERVALLEEALATRGDRRDALTVRLTARLAHALLFSDQRARRGDLAEAAVAMARAVGDDQALAAALYAWSIVNVTSANYAERLAAVDELLALGRASGSDDAEAWALHFHAHHMAEGGDLAAFDADVAAGEAIARRTRNATWQWTALVHRAMRATMQGRFAEGEALGDEAYAIGSRSQQELAGATLGAGLVALRTWQGRLDELEPLIVAGAGRYPEIPAIWAAVPYAHAELGRTAEAADELRRAVASHALEDMPGAQSWTVALAMLARAAALTGDAEVAGRVRDLLVPLADRHVVGPFADCYFGPASLYVGLCAATAGDLDTACDRLERALGQAAAVGARPVAAWTRAELAGALERRDGRSSDRVTALRAEAAAELAELGMSRHLARLGDAEAVAPPRHATPEPGPPGPPAPNEFRRTPAGWSISYDGRTVDVRHTKGLADIHRLLAAPGVELHVLELAQEAGGPAAPGGASRQPVLDERAKAEFREQVLALQADVDDARACADIARAERAEAELDFVVAELAAGLGFGGRDRTMTDAAERARQAVRARIRYSLDRLDRVHPALRRHLDRALVTGTFCSYQPERPTSWVTGDQDGP